MDNRGRRRTLILVSILLIMSVLTLAACSKPASTPAPTQKAASAPTQKAAPAPTQKAAPAPTSAAPKQVTVTIRTGSFGGDSYLFGFALADLINKNSTRVRASAFESGGTVGTLKNLMKLSPDAKKVNLSLGVELMYRLAAKGMSPFDKATTYADARALVSYARGVDMFITWDPKIKTPQDMIGKRIAIGAHASSLEVSGESCLKALGIFDKVKVSYLAWNAQVDAMRDGLIDVGWLYSSENPTGWAPTSLYAELMTTRKGWHVIGIPADTIKKAGEIVGFPFTSFTVPAGTFGPGQPETAAAGIGEVHGLWADKVFPEDVAYEIVRIIYERTDDFGKYADNLRTVNRTKMIDIPGPKTADNWHPGAIKYFKEKKVM